MSFNIHLTVVILYADVCSTILCINNACLEYRKIVIIHILVWYVSLSLVLCFGSIQNICVYEKLLVKYCFIYDCHFGLLKLALLKLSP